MGASATRQESCRHPQRAARRGSPSMQGMPDGRSGLGMTGSASWFTFLLAVWSGLLSFVAEADPGLVLSRAQRRVQIQARLDETDRELADIGQNLSLAQLVLGRFANTPQAQQAIFDNSAVPFFQHQTFTQLARKYGNDPWFRELLQNTPQQTAGALAPFLIMDRIVSALQRGAKEPLPANQAPSNQRYLYRETQFVQEVLARKKAHLEQLKVTLVDQMREVADPLTIIAQINIAQINPGQNNATNPALPKMTGIFTNVKVNFFRHEVLDSAGCQSRSHAFSGGGDTPTVYLPATLVETSQALETLPVPHGFTLQEGYSFAAAEQRRGDLSVANTSSAAAGGPGNPAVVAVPLAKEVITTPAQIPLAHLALPQHAHAALEQLKCSDDAPACAQSVLATLSGEFFRVAEGSVDAAKAMGRSLITENLLARAAAQVLAHTRAIPARAVTVSHAICSAGVDICTASPEKRISLEVFAGGRWSIVAVPISPTRESPKYDPQSFARNWAITGALVVLVAAWKGWSSTTGLNPVVVPKPPVFIVGGQEISGEGLTWSGAIPSMLSVSILGSLLVGAIGWMWRNSGGESWVNAHSTEQKKADATKNAIAATLKKEVNKTANPLDELLELQAQAVAARDRCACRIIFLPAGYPTALHLGIEECLSSFDHGPAGDALRSLDQLDKKTWVDSRTWCTRRDQKHIGAFLRGLSPDLQELLAARLQPRTYSEQDPAFLCAVGVALRHTQSLTDILDIATAVAFNFDELLMSSPANAEDHPTWQRQPEVGGRLFTYQRPSDLNRLYLANRHLSIEDNILQGAAYTLGETQLHRADGEDDGSEEPEKLLIFGIDVSDPNFGTVRAKVLKTVLTLRTHHAKLKVLVVLFGGKAGFKPFVLLPNASIVAELEQILAIEFEGNLASSRVRTFLVDLIRWLETWGEFDFTGIANLHIGFSYSDSDDFCGSRACLENELLPNSDIPPPILHPHCVGFNCGQSELDFRYSGHRRLYHPALLLYHTGEFGDAHSLEIFTVLRRIWDRLLGVERNAIFLHFSSILQGQPLSFTKKVAASPLPAESTRREEELTRRVEEFIRRRMFGHSSNGRIRPPVVHDRVFERNDDLDQLQRHPPDKIHDEELYQELVLAIEQLRKRFATEYHAEESAYTKPVSARRRQVLERKEEYEPIRDRILHHWDRILGAEAGSHE